MYQVLYAPYLYIKMLFDVVQVSWILSVKNHYFLPTKVFVEITEIVSNLTSTGLVFLRCIAKGKILGKKKIYIYIRN